MLKQIQFQMKRYRGGRLIALCVMLGISGLLLLTTWPQRSAAVQSPFVIIAIVLTALMVPIYIIPPIVDIFREYFRLYSKNKGVMTFLTPAKGFHVVFSRVLTLGLAFYVCLLLGVLPLLLYTDNVVGSLDSTVFRFVGYLPDLRMAGWELVVEASSTFATLAMLFTAGAFYRTVFAPLSGRVILAIGVFIVGSYLLSYLDLLAFLPESWRIQSYFGGILEIQASLDSALTTGLYVLLQIAKTLGLCALSGWLLDKKIDISA